MNRKQFLILMLALLVMGGAGLALFWQDITAYRSTSGKIGAKLLPEFKLADVARIELQDARSKTTLVRKDTYWVVEERGGYPANFQDISDLLIKLVELKVVQSEVIGPSLLPRVGLAPVPPKPAADAEAGKEVGTLLTMKDGAGKALATLTLGKVVLKKDPGNPLPAAQDGVPAGRWVQVAGAPNVAVVSDPLAKAEADPSKWLDRAFIKADRVKTLTVAGESGVRWKVTRDQEWGQWKFAAGGGELNAGAAVAATNVLSKWEFADVLTAMPEATGKPLVVTAETFDRLTYTFTFTPVKNGQYAMATKIDGEPARTRTPEKDEKAEEKDKRDKDYADALKLLEARLARERAQANWLYLMDAKSLGPLTLDRGDIVAPPKR